MEEHDAINRAYSYLFYAAAVLCLACGAFLSNAYLVLSTSVLLLLSAVYLNSGHILNNVLIRRSSVIEVYNGYRLSEGLDSAVKKVGGSYQARSIAVLIAEKAGGASHEAIRNLVESIHEPFEFGIMLREADRKRIMEGLETRRRMKEISISRMDQKKQDRMNALKREIDILDSEIENVRKGGKALEVVMKLGALASSESRAEAARESSASIRHIADAFSASLGLGYEILKGEELLAFIEAHS